MQDEIFRLREGEEILGFMRIVDNRPYYSVNGYQWTGNQITFDNKDLFTGFKDRNDRRIFERDVLSSTDYPSNEYIIHYDSVLNKFLLVSYKNRDIFNVSVEQFFENKSKVRRIGFLRQ